MGGRDVTRAALALRDAVLSLPELEDENDAGEQKDPPIDFEPTSIAPSSHAAPFVVVRQPMVTLPLRK